MSKDSDLLIALSEAVILLLDYTLHRASLDDELRLAKNEKRDGPK